MSFVITHAIANAASNRVRQSQINRAQANGQRERERRRARLNDFRRSNTHNAANATEQRSRDLMRAVREMQQERVQQNRLRMHDRDVQVR
jgi:hypothetical protein